MPGANNLHLAESQPTRRDTRGAHDNRRSCLPIDCAAIQATRSLLGRDHDVGRHAVLAWRSAHRFMAALRRQRDWRCGGSVVRHILRVQHGHVRRRNIRYGNHVRRAAA